MGLSSVKVRHRNIVPRGRACLHGTFLCNCPYVLGYRWQRTKPGRTSLVSWVSVHLQVQPTRWGNTTLKTCWLSSVISTVAVSTHSQSSTRWKRPPRRRIARQLLCLPQVRFCLVILQPFGAIIIFLILAHPVYKMWIIQEPNMLELWNRLHFEEKKTDCIQYV